MLLYANVYTYSYMVWGIVDDDICEWPKNERHMKHRGANWDHKIGLEPEAKT